MKTKFKLWMGWDLVCRFARNILAAPRRKKRWLELSAKIRGLREQRDIATRIEEYALARKYSAVFISERESDLFIHP
jgi:hypothetical protein